MPDKYKIESTSNKSAKVDDIELSLTSTTRRIIRPMIIDNPKDQNASVRIDILHQRASNKQFEDISAERLSTYKAKEIGKLSLSCEETRKLYNHLKNLYAMYDDLGTPIGEGRVIVGFEDEIILTDPKRAALIKILIEKGHSEEVWSTLVESDPDLATKLSYAQIQHFRANAILEFEEMLKQPELNESDWQNFFEKNTWIFGYGLNYQILRNITNQPVYGGQTYVGSGANKGDFLQSTQGNIKFTVLVEIKKPTTVLLDSKRYRNDVFIPSNEFIGGVSQLRMNARIWEHEGSLTTKNRDDLESRSTYTVNPHAILIIGNTNQLTDRAQRDNFELFRQAQIDMDVITFDEIFERAKYIVNHTDQNKNNGS